ncbi:MAG: DUF6470 family protein [Oscillospiraceae bacterium]|nr:DUF6470 family protein [Oscillospiraceae bacterium]
MRQLLQISQTPMRINYSYQRGRLSMRQHKAELDINVQRPNLRVTRDPIKLIVDQTESFESMNRYKPVRFSQKIAAEAKQIAMETTAQINDDARAMTLTRGAAHIDICKRKTGEHFVETIMDFIPVAPRISWVGGVTKVDFTPFSMDINWRVNPRPEINYEPGKFNMNVAQWNKVDIAYTGTYDDLVTIGRHIRHKI